MLSTYCVKLHHREERKGKMERIEKEIKAFKRNGESKILHDLKCLNVFTIFSIVSKYNCWSFIFCRRRDKGILPNVLHHIGGTPLIRINKISAAAGIECELRKFDLLKY